MGDLDGDLKSDDLCDVDTRIDRVVIRSLTGKYASFPLEIPLAGHKAGTVAPMGCLIGDLNEDGLPDLLVYFWGRPPVAYMRTPAARQPGTAILAVRADTFAVVEIANPSQRWFTNAVTFADVDGDGHQDLIVGNYFCDEGRILDPDTSEPACPAGPVMQDSMSRAFNGGLNRILLWRSAESGERPSVQFTEVTGVFPPDVAAAWTLAIGAQDLNGDLMPDLYFANDFGPDRLLINCSKAEKSFGKTRAELGCFPLDGPVSFRLVEGRRSWTKPSSKVLGRDSFKGMGVDFGDLNGDGIPDLYVSNITERWALQESQFVFVSDGRPIGAELVQAGLAPYSDESESLGLSRSGWAWDAKLADFDNDGRLEALQALGFSRGDKGGPSLSWRKSCWSMLQELATANDVLLKQAASWFDMAAVNGAKGCDLSGGTPNPFFVMNPHGRYEDVALKVFPDEADPPWVSRGIAIADIDQDGRLDYVVAHQFGPPTFHHNTSPTAAVNSFIGITPRFVVSGPAKSGLFDADASASVTALPSRPAFGTTARLRLSDGRVLSQQVDGGNGHSGKRSPDLHFGLGALGDTRITSIEFEWRAGADSQRQIARFSNVVAGKHYVALLQAQPTKGNP